MFIVFFVQQVSERHEHKREEHEQDKNQITHNANSNLPRDVEIVFLSLYQGIRYGIYTRGTAHTTFIMKRHYTNIHLFGVANLFVSVNFKPAIDISDVVINCEF